MSTNSDKRREFIEKLLRLFSYVKSITWKILKFFFKVFIAFLLLILLRFILDEFLYIILSLLFVILGELIGFLAGLVGINLNDLVYYQGNMSPKVKILRNEKSSLPPRL